jgi:hypothetical protein
MFRYTPHYMYTVLYIMPIHSRNELIISNPAAFCTSSTYTVLLKLINLNPSNLRIEPESVFRREEILMGAARTFLLGSLTRKRYAARPPLAHPGVAAPLT